MSNAEPKSPLTIIAIFAGIIEASALASPPFLGEDSQEIYTWFLVGFPPFLTLLFFLTLNFNTRSLYVPDNTESPTEHAQETAASNCLTQEKNSNEEPIAEHSSSAVEYSTTGTVKREQCRDDPNDTLHEKLNELCEKLAQLELMINTPNSPVLPDNTPPSSIFLSGSGANQFIEHHVLSALKQSRLSPSNGSGESLVFYNMDAGIQTTITNKPMSSTPHKAWPCTDPQ